MVDGNSGAVGGQDWERGGGKMAGDLGITEGQHSALIEATVIRASGPCGPALTDWDKP